MDEISVPYSSWNIAMGCILLGRQMNVYFTIRHFFERNQTEEKHVCINIIDNKKNRRNASEAVGTTNKKEERE